MGNRKRDVLVSDERGRVVPDTWISVFVSHEKDSVSIPGTAGLKDAVRTGEIVRNRMCNRNMVECWYIDIHVVRIETYNTVFACCDCDKCNLLMGKHPGCDQLFRLLPGEAFFYFTRSERSELFANEREREIFRPFTRCDSSLVAPNMFRACASRSGYERGKAVS